MTKYTSKPAEQALHLVTSWPNNQLFFVIFICLIIQNTNATTETSEQFNQIDTSTSSTTVTTLTRISNDPTVIENASTDNLTKDVTSTTSKTTNHVSSESAPTRVYLQKGNLQEGYLVVKKENIKENRKASVDNAPNGIQTNIQIYIIFFIGVLPATIGAFVWWLQNLRRKCSRSEGVKRDTVSGSSSSDGNKLSHSLVKAADINKVPIDSLVHQIAKRAEKMSTDADGAQLYNSYRSRLIKSRRVYSLEVPRKCIEMIEILGEGNFGQESTSSTVIKVCWFAFFYLICFELLGLESKDLSDERQKEANVGGNKDKQSECQ